MDKKSITVTEFYDTYTKVTSETIKEAQVQNLIYREYVPILEKKIALQKAFDRSLVGENGNQYIDMFLHKINTTITILTMYTNLDFKKDKDSENNLFDDYDILAENDLLNAIFNHIPQSELKMILSINEQITNTFYNETQSPKAYITELIDRISINIGTVADSGLNALADVVKDEKKMNNILKRLPDFSKIISAMDKFGNK